jgi:hypothetical protein
MPTTYRLHPDFFRELATIYTRAAGGTYTTVSTTGMPCRLEAVSVSEAVTGGGRAELAALRSLYYHPDYTVPNDARIGIVGRPERWQVRANTQTPYPEDSDTPAWWQVDVVRAV